MGLSLGHNVLSSGRPRGSGISWLPSGEGPRVRILLSKYLSATCVSHTTLMHKALKGPRQ